MINSVEDIANLLVSGVTEWRKYGRVYTKTEGVFTLFSYMPQAQYEGRWNFFERVSRGLVINNQTGEIVVRPFDKFFNWGEKDRDMFTRRSESPIEYVSAKLDGSLGLLMRDEDGSYRIITRGSFDSEQGQWATKFLHECYPDLRVPISWTLMFEIVYPENKIVVDYGNQSFLAVIGARNRFTGEYIDLYDLTSFIFDWGLRPTEFYFGSEWTVKRVIDEVSKMMGEEGYVVKFMDGQFFKFKSPEYLRLHKLIGNITFKTTLEAIKAGRFYEYMMALPDEFHEQVDAWGKSIIEQRDAVRTSIAMAYRNAPKTDNQKEFALWVNENHKDLAPYLFFMRKNDDEQALARLIWDRHSFEERE